MGTSASKDDDSSIEEEYGREMPSKSRYTSPKSRNISKQAARLIKSIPPTEAAPSTDSIKTVDPDTARLMTYLKTVAENSTNLPKTRRDDPDLGRIVSTLTAEEYALKSEAFIPADVRVIGGIFSKYPRVWDLPTGSEFMLSDGAQEPGLSFGGACCNALLKILYDNAKPKNGQNDPFINPDDLFDDEEDDEEEENVEDDADRLNLIKKFTMTGSITWAELLRKMNDHMKEVGYVQNPAISASSKIDLEDSFTIVPSEFDPEKNKKRALLIGVNYSRSKDAKLTTSHDDVKSIKDFLCNCHDFPEEGECMTVLLDDGMHKEPTHDNIIKAFKALAAASEPGDAVFVQFSGHGCRILDIPINSDVEGYDEVIVPSDFGVGDAIIRDTVIFSSLIAQMPKGVTVICLFDACDKGFILDLPYSWTTRLEQVDVAKMTLNESFSFIRYLKATKTLYDSSIFNQVGIAVDANLEENTLTHAERSFDESSTGSLVTVDETFTARVREGFVASVISACHNPTLDEAKPRKSTGKKSAPGGKDEFNVGMDCGIMDSAKAMFSEREGYATDYNGTFEDDDRTGTGESSTFDDDDKSQ